MQIATVTSATPPFELKHWKWTVNLIFSSKSMERESNELERRVDDDDA
jgi:hypothetical protein